MREHARAVPFDPNLIAQGVPIERMVCDFCERIYAPVEGDRACRPVRLRPERLPMHLRPSHLRLARCPTRRRPMQTPACAAATAPATR